MIYSHPCLSRALFSGKHFLEIFTTCQRKHLICPNANKFRRKGGKITFVCTNPWKSHIRNYPICWENCAVSEFRVSWYWFSCSLLGLYEVFALWGHLHVLIKFSVIAITAFVPRGLCPVWIQVQFWCCRDTFGTFFIWSYNITLPREEATFQDIWRFHVLWLFSALDSQMQSMVLRFEITAWQIGKSVMGSSIKKCT